MEEQIMQSVASLGAIGLIGGYIFVTFMKERTEERKVNFENQKEDRELFRKSVEKFMEIAETFDKRLDGMEKDMSHIKDDVEILLKKGGNE